MDMAYKAADFIISRAGAGSVSELCMVGKPVIFIPSPNVAEDHQTKNALALVKKGAALMIREGELDQKFEMIFSALCDSTDQQASLSMRIKDLAMPEATEMIVDQIESLHSNRKINNEYSCRTFRSIQKYLLHRYWRYWYVCTCPIFSSDR